MMLLNLSTLTMTLLFDDSSILAHFPLKISSIYY